MVLKRSWKVLNLTCSNLQKPCVWTRRDFWLKTPAGLKFCIGQVYRCISTVCRWGRCRAHFGTLIIWQPPASHFPSSPLETPQLTGREKQTQPQGILNTDLKMLALINRLLDWFRSLFWKEEMELTLVGLQYSGKTTFVNVIAVSLQLLT